MKKDKQNNLENKFNFDNDYFIGISDNKKKKNKNKKNKKDKKNSKKTKLKNKSQKKVDVNKFENATVGVPVNKKINKKLMMQEKKKHRRIIIAKIVLLLIILTAIVAFLFISPTFNITQIEVNQNSKISAEKIESISGLQKYKNIFRFSKSKIIENIKNSEPYIGEVKIKRLLPGKVQIEVQERSAVLQIELEDKSYAYIDKDGYILEFSDEKLDFPIIYKPKTNLENIKSTYTENKVTARLTETDLNSIGLLLQVKDIMKDYEMDSFIVGFTISDENDLVVNLNEKQNNKKVYLGDCSDLNTRILYLKEILDKTKGEKGEIFINGSLNKDEHEVYFRKQV